VLPTRAPAAKYVPVVDSERAPVGGGVAAADVEHGTVFEGDPRDRVTRDDRLAMHRA